MSIRIWQVDAFTDRPFTGNPAAVCLLPAPRDAAWMQAVAAEMNLSETAFLLPRMEDAQPGYNLRWFTPTTEVDLCGHATLASAHVLWEEGLLKQYAPAHFHTRSGLLVATRLGSHIEMDFPSEPAHPVELPAGLAEALGLNPLYTARNRFDYLVLAESEEAVLRMQPDFRALGQIPARGFIVSAPAQRSGYDFVSRFFAPACGINEDPVTGSAHCCLGPFWKERLHKSEFTAYQASARGGVVRIRVAGERTFLGGKAVTVLRGSLHV